MADLIKCTAFFTGGLLAIFLVASAYSGSRCHAQANAMGMESHYDFFTDCMIKVNDRWVPIGSFKIITVKGITEK
jgi:hypothetical protein